MSIIRINNHHIAYRDPPLSGEARSHNLMEFCQLLEQRKIPFESGLMKTKNGVPHIGFYVDGFSYYFFCSNKQFNYAEKSDTKIIMPNGH